MPRHFRTTYLFTALEQDREVYDRNYFTVEERWMIHNERAYLISHCGTEVKEPYQIDNELENKINHLLK